MLSACPLLTQANKLKTSSKGLIILIVPHAKTVVRVHYTMVYGAPQLRMHAQYGAPQLRMLNVYSLLKQTSSQLLASKMQQN